MSEAVLTAQPEAIISGPDTSVEVKENGKVEKNIGESITTDEILVLGSLEDRAKTAPKKATKAKDSEVSESKEPVNPDQGIVEIDLKKADSTKIPPAPEKVKTYKALMGDKFSELPENAVFEFTVNGKPEKVPLRDIISNYNGKVVWDRKFNELHQQKQGFESERGQFKSFVSDIMEAVNSQNVDRMLRTAAKYSGLDQTTTEKAISQYYQKAAEQILQWQQMTPEQRKIAEYERKEAERSLDDQKAKTAAEQKAEHEKLVSEIDQVLKLPGMSQEVFVARYDDLKKLQEQNPAFGDITPQKVAKYHQDCVMYDTVYNVLEQIPQGKQLASNLEVVKYAKGIVERNPDFGVEDLKEVFIETFGPRKDLSAQEKKTLQAKVQKNQPKIQSKSQTPNSASKRPIMTFDDLDTF